MNSSFRFFMCFFFFLSVFLLFSCRSSSSEPYFETPVSVFVLDEEFDCGEDEKSAPAIFVADNIMKSGSRIKLINGCDGTLSSVADDPEEGGPGIFLHHEVIDVSVSVEKQGYSLGATGVPAGEEGFCESSTAGVFTVHHLGKNFEFPGSEAVKTACLEYVPVKTVPVSDGFLIAGSGINGFEMGFYDNEAELIHSVSSEDIPCDEENNNCGDPVLKNIVCESSQCFLTTDENMFYKFEFKGGKFDFTLLDIPDPDLKPGFKIEKAGSGYMVLWNEKIVLVVSAEDLSVRNKVFIPASMEPAAFSTVNVTEKAYYLMTQKAFINKINIPLIDDDSEDAEEIEASELNYVDVGEEGVLTLFVADSHGLVRPYDLDNGGWVVMPSNSDESEEKNGTVEMFPFNSRLVIEHPEDESVDESFFPEIKNLEVSRGLMRKIAYELRYEGSLFSSIGEISFDSNTFIDENISFDRTSFNPSSDKIMITDDRDYAECPLSVDETVTIMTGDILDEHTSSDLGTSSDNNTITDCFGDVFSYSAFAGSSYSVQKNDENGKFSKKGRAEELYENMLEDPGVSYSDEDLSFAVYRKSETETEKSFTFFFEISPGVNYLYYSIYSDVKKMYGTSDGSLIVFSRNEGTLFHYRTTEDIRYRLYE
ncbi:MAG: hypothetical protein R6W70_03005 [bacterium]